MRAVIRSVIVAILALLGAVVIGVASTITSAVTLAATALIVPGTGDPDPDAVTNYKPNARDYYIAPFNPACTADSNPECNLVGIPYIAQFWPFPFPGWGGLSGATWDVSVASGVASLNSTLINTLTNNPGEDIIIFGYSQGAKVVSIEKQTLANVENKDQFSFVLIGNIVRPNGGLFERLAILGHVPILDTTFGEPTPTDTGIQTTDIAFEYDGVSDFPLYPINLLAVANALAGFEYIHGDYLNPTSKNPGALPYGYTPETLQAAVNDPANRQTFGDTTYVTIPATTLPILQPLRDLGASNGATAITEPIADLIEPTLRVLIDLGYDRSINPGQPSPARLVPIINPVELTVDLAEAAVKGVEDALGAIGGTPLSPSTPPSPTDSSTSAAAKAADEPADTSPVTSVSRSNPVSSKTIAPKPDPEPSDDDNGVTEAKAKGDTKSSKSTAADTKPSATKPERPKSWRPTGQLTGPRTSLSRLFHGKSNTSDSPEADKAGVAAGAADDGPSTGDGTSNDTESGDGTS
jgi:PE-PPE domain